MPGPQPDPNKRRRNAATIAGHVLPAEGRRGRAPKVPKPYVLGEAGKAWWRWAWRLPQATMWDEGMMYAAARRAKIEDDLAALGFRDELDLADLLAGADSEAIKRVEWALAQLKRMASGSTTLMKEATQIEDRLGLNPKSLAALRWKIETTADAGTKTKPGKAGDAPGVTELDAYRERTG